MENLTNAEFDYLLDQIMEDYFETEFQKILKLKKPNYHRVEWNQQQKIKRRKLFEQIRQYRYDPPTPRKKSESFDVYIDPSKKKDKSPIKTSNKKKGKGLQVRK